MPLLALPPVRQAIPLRRSSVAAGRATVEHLFPGWNFTLVGSGTQALALALARLRETCASDRPRVVLPAYGCPDLVAACMHARLYPVLVDLAPGRWGYDPEQLDMALRDKVMAVVAVNLLGLGDEAASLRQRLAGTPVRLVQDCAQHLPAQEAERTGDAIVLSFGRGKPVNLMGGGALLTRNADGPPAAPVSGGSLQADLVHSRAAAAVFNAATHPLLYGITARLPGLAVGATRYRALAGVSRLPDTFFRCLGPAVDAYRADPSPGMQSWCPRLRHWQEHGVSLLRGHDDQAGRPLLRLPLLAADRRHRDALVAGLAAAGLGASIMYGRSLEQLQGMPRQVAGQGPFPVAAALAGRFFTLPTHRFVTHGIADLATRCIETCAPAESGHTSR